MKIVIATGVILCATTFAFSQRWMGGRWEGKGYQIDSDETWTMKLRKQKKKFSIEYPSLECTGEWKLINFNKTRARFRENIKTNRENCEPTGSVIIQRLNSRQLMFIYSYKGSSQAVASGILTKAK